MTGLGLHSLRLLTRMTSLSTCPFPRFPCIPSLTKDMCRDLLMSRPMVGCAQPRSIPIPQQRRRTRLFGLQHIRSMHNSLDFRHINFNVSAGLYVIYLRSRAFHIGYLCLRHPQVLQWNRPNNVYPRRSTGFTGFDLYILYTKYYDADLPVAKSETRESASGCSFLFWLAISMTLNLCNR